MASVSDSALPSNPHRRPPLPPIVFAHVAGIADVDRILTRRRQPIWIEWNSSASDNTDDERDLPAPTRARLATQYLVVGLPPLNPVVAEDASDEELVIQSFRPEDSPTFIARLAARHAAFQAAHPELAPRTGTCGIHHVSDEALASQVSVAFAPAEEALEQVTFVTRRVPEQYRPRHSSNLEMAVGVGRMLVAEAAAAAASVEAAVAAAAAAAGPPLAMEVAMPVTAGRATTALHRSLSARRRGVRAAGDASAVMGLATAGVVRYAVMLPAGTMATERTDFVLRWRSQVAAIIVPRNEV